MLSSNQACYLPLNIDYLYQCSPPDSLVVVRVVFLRWRGCCGGLKSLGLAGAGGESHGNERPGALSPLSRLLPWLTSFIATVTTAALALACLLRWAPGTPFGWPQREFLAATRKSHLQREAPAPCLSQEEFGWLLDRPRSPRLACGWREHLCA